MRERQEAFRDARLIVIASEGKDTERIYFKALAKEYTNPRVHVHILERNEVEQNSSSPEHVLKQLNNYKEQYELEADDELWSKTAIFQMFSKQEIGIEHSSLRSHGDIRDNPYINKYCVIRQGELIVSQSSKED